MSCFSERKYTTAWPVELITIKLYLPLLFLIFSFSIQFYGECWSGATAPLTYDRYGRSLHCTSEVGGMHANLVYRFVGEGQWGCLFIIFFYFYVSLFVIEPVIGGGDSNWPSLCPYVMIIFTLPSNRLYIHV